MSTFDCIKTRTHWVQRKEEFSSGCSSGFFALGQWLLASLLALFAGINRRLPHGVPIVANASVGDLRWFGNGAGALKSSAFVWRGVVFVAFIVGMMATGRAAWAGIYDDTSENLKSFGYNVKIGDINSDGKDDVVISVIHQEPDTFVPPYTPNPSGNDEDYPKGGIYIWISDGSFPLTSTPIFLEGGPNIALGDIDNDGDLDIVSNEVIWRWNSESDVFGSKEPIPGLCVDTRHLYSDNLELGDIDNDGYLDVVCLQSESFGSYRGEIWNNINTKTKDSSDDATFDVGNARDIALGDLDKDGLLEIVVANHSGVSSGHGGAIQIFKNDGFPFSTLFPIEYEDKYKNAQDEYHPPITRNSKIYGVDLGDIDNDGDLDIVTKHAIWLNEGDGTFEERTVPDLPGGNYTYTDANRIPPFTDIEYDNTIGVALGDINNDGFLDAFFANIRSIQLGEIQKSAVCINNETTAIFDSCEEIGTAVPSNEYGWLWRVALGDIDGDGDLDAVTTSQLDIPIPSPLSEPVAAMKSYKNKLWKNTLSSKPSPIPQSAYEAGFAQNKYCLWGDATDKSYSWKLFGVDSDGNSTFLGKKLNAMPVVGVNTDLANAFVTSLKNKVSVDVTVELGMPDTHCFYIDKDESSPYDSFKLYVGKGGLEPTCLVDVNKPCSYNPTIVKIPSCISPPQGTVAWYTFDDGATKGKFGQAASFDGSNSIEIPHDTQLNFGEGDFSISAWVKTSENYGYILNKMYLNSSTGNRQGYALYLNQGKFGMQLADGDGFGGCSINGSAPCTDYISNAFIADNKWHLVAVTVDRDNSNGGKFYVDGLEVDTFNPTYRMGSLDNDQSLVFGSGFKGELDEVSLTQGVLSTNDIIGYYKADAGFCSEVTNILQLSITSKDISATNGTFTFEVANTGSGTMNWTAQTDVNWLTIRNASGTNDGTITVNYTANSGDARTGTITVTANGAENSPQTVTVNQAGSIPKISVAPNVFHSFANTSIGYSLVETFTISNIGTGNLDIGTVTMPNSSYFVVQNDTCSSQTITPKNTCVIEVAFSPQSKNPKSISLSVPSNDPSNSSLTLYAYGNGIYVPAISADVDTMSFGNVDVGSSSTAQILTVSNTGMANLNVGTITLGNSEDFLLQEDTCSNQAIAPDNNCTIKVVFLPQSEGIKSATLNIPSNAPNSPFDMPLDGEGDSPAIGISTIVTCPFAQVQVNDNDLIDLETVSTDGIGMVTVNGAGVGSTRRGVGEFLIVYNTGNAPLELTNFEFVDGNASNFELVHARSGNWRWHWVPGCFEGGLTSRTLSGGHCTVAVRIKSGTPVGTKTTTLKISSNDPNTPVFNIQVQAEVVDSTPEEMSKADCSSPDFVSNSPSPTVGFWNNPNSWTPNGVPNVNDVVLIREDDFMLGTAGTIQIKTLCNRGTLSSFGLLPLSVEAAHGISNFKTGIITSNSDPSELDLQNCDEKTGANVFLKAGTDFGTEEDWRHETICRQAMGAPIYNDGIIESSRGGDGENCAGTGGDVVILGKNVLNDTNGIISAGRGGNVTTTGTGGKGGYTTVWGKLGGPGFLINHHIIEAGDGGTGCPGGNGGGLGLYAEPNLVPGTINAGVGGGALSSCSKGKKGPVWIEPSAIVFDENTKVQGGDVIVFGGEDWTLDLSNANRTLVDATGDITLQVGKNSVIDLSGNTTTVLKAEGKVTILSDTVLLDEGVQLSDIIDATKIVTGPGKIRYAVSVMSIGKTVGKPDTNLPIRVTIANSGPTLDTYALSIGDTANWQISTVEPSLTLSGLTTIELPLDVTLPETLGATNTITVTATSQTDPSVSASTQIVIEVTDGKLVLSERKPSVSYKASGTLKDKEGNSLAGVTIQIGEKTTVTDAAGNWQIDGLPEGEYAVTASKDGYRFDTTPCVVSNNVDTCQPKIKGEPLLDVKVVPEPRIAKQGENVTYRITVTNQGEGIATNVTLVDALPNKAELVKLAALDGGNCDETTLTCQLPELTPGATANLELVVSNRLAETLVNTVTVTTKEYPTEVKKTWTSVKPYLSVTLVDQPDPVTMLNVLHYRLVVALNQYAPSDATGVTVVSQLPQGVELKSIKSDDGVCDTNTSSQITCQLNDLSIASADSISQATVEMEVQLTDGGLLLLTHQAKVTANEYPAHQIYEPTTIFIPKEIQVDLAMVVDVTGSMEDEMNSVIKALKEFAEELDTSTAPLMTLITFGDEVKVTAFTRNIDVLRGAIEDLTASGGGLCEEASVEALLVAIPHTKAEGDILFATDASPYPDADVKKVLDLLKDKAIHFNAFITGDCTMQDSWNQLP